MDLVNWYLLADRLKGNPLIRNDAGLAKAVGVSQQLMSEWQKGSSTSHANKGGQEVADLPLRAKIRLLELGSYPRVKAFLLLGQPQSKVEKMEARNREIEKKWKEGLPEAKPLPTEAELFVCEYSAVQDLLEAVSPSDGSRSKLKVRAK